MGALYFVWSDARDGIVIGAEPSETHLAHVWVRGIVDELHGKLIATQKHRIRVVLLGLQARAKVIQRCL